MVFISKALSTTTTVTIHSKNIPRLPDYFLKLFFYCLWVSFGNSLGKVVYFDILADESMMTLRPGSCISEL